MFADSSPGVYFVAVHGIVCSDRFSQDDRVNIFTPAETQTSQMLADNLLAKFRATEGYQRIAEGLLAIASGDEDRVHCLMAAKSKSKPPVSKRSSTTYTKRWKRVSKVN